MKTAAVSEIKASLSEYLARVKGGEEVIVTDRGRPVAKIVPLGREDLDLPAELLALEKAGLVRIGREPLAKDFWKRPRPHDPKARAVRALLEEREEGR